MNGGRTHWADDDVPAPATDEHTAFLDDEAVVYLVDSARSVLLNRSAAVIWSLVDGFRTVAGIVDEVVARYAIDRHRVSHDLDDSLTALEGLGLLSRFSRSSSINLSTG